jgi:hypothetical protein
MQKLYSQQSFSVEQAAAKTQAMEAFAPEPTAKEAPSARRSALEHSHRRLAHGTNADGYAPPLDDDDDQPTRGRRPLPRRPSARSLAA